MKVLLTGVAGFIGSHVAEAYLTAGYEVIGIDNFYSGDKKNLHVCEKSPRFTFVEGDIRDKEPMAELIKKHKPDVINHHAAQKSVPASVDDPHFDAQVNILGLLNLLWPCKDSPIKQFIFSSTGGALSPEPTGDKLPNENDKPQMVSPYAVTKFASEQYIALYSQLFGFAYTALRYANVFGPRQVPAGECGVVPIFMENALKNKPSTLFAYPDMPDGCTRDYVYISDVVEANMLATKTPANAAINIGCGKELPISEIYHQLMKAMGKDIPLHREGPRAGDIKRSVLDNTLAKELIHWSPKVDLLEGLKRLCTATS